MQGCREASCEASLLTPHIEVLFFLFASNEHMRLETVPNESVRPLCDKLKIPSFSEKNTDRKFIGIWLKNV